MTPVQILERLRIVQKEMREGSRQASNVMLQHLVEEIEDRNPVFWKDGGVNHETVITHPEIYPDPQGPVVRAASVIVLLRWMLNLGERPELRRRW